MSLLSKLRKRAAPRYYHGGPRGLSVGEKILPRNALPQWRGLSVTWQAGQPAADFGDLGDTVSLTTDRTIAHAYAGNYLSPQNVRTAGQVYQVEPLAPVELDPDFPASASTICRCTRGARIVAALDVVPVETNPRVLTKALAPHIVALRTHEPFYDDEGYIIFTEAWERFGATPTTLRALGPWIPKHLIPLDRFHIPSNLPPLL